MQTVLQGAAIAVAHRSISRQRGGDIAIRVFSGQSKLGHATHE